MEKLGAPRVVSASEPVRDVRAVGEVYGLQARAHTGASGVRPGCVLVPFPDPSSPTPSNPAPECPHADQPRGALRGDGTSLRALQLPRVPARALGVLLERRHLDAIAASSLEATRSPFLRYPRVKNAAAASASARLRLSASHRALAAFSASAATTTAPSARPSASAAPASSLANRVKPFHLRGPIVRRRRRGQPLFDSSDVIGAGGHVRAERSCAFPRRGDPFPAQVLGLLPRVRVLELAKRGFERARWRLEVVRRVLPVKRDSRRDARAQIRVHRRLGQPESVSVRSSSPTPYLSPRSLLRLTLRSTQNGTPFAAPSRRTRAVLA